MNSGGPSHHQKNQQQQQRQKCSVHTLYAYCTRFVADFLMVNVSNFVNHFELCASAYTCAIVCAWYGFSVYILCNKSSICFGGVQRLSSEINPMDENASYNVYRWHRSSLWLAAPFDMENGIFVSYEHIRYIQCTSSFQSCQRQPNHLATNNQIVFFVPVSWLSFKLVYTFGLFSPFNIPTEVSSHRLYVLAYHRRYCALLNKSNSKFILSAWKQFDIVLLYELLDSGLELVMSVLLNWAETFRIYSGCSVCVA